MVLNRALLSLLVVAAGTVSASASGAPTPSPTTALWYTQPAGVWTEALPVGNGRLGAMVFGAPSGERLQVNDDTLWNGKPHDYAHPGAAEVLPELRRLLWAGKKEEAEALAMERFMSVPLRQMAYQPMVDLHLAFPGHELRNASGYRRHLDLDTAIATVTYRVGDVTFTRETFSSHAHQVLVERVAADRPGALRFTVRLDSPHAQHAVEAWEGGQLLLTGRVQEDGLRFAAQVSVAIDGGTVSTEGTSIAIEGADAATILLTGATSFVSFENIDGDPVKRSAGDLKAAMRHSYEALKSSHVADHQKLFKRVAIDLGTTPAGAKPTYERLAAKDKSKDPALAALLFNFGRYLLISSSRPGSQPANLQGIWNDKLDPPWGSKYTTNINAEMNYWPAEVANLAECHEPLFAMIDDLVVSGRRTAKTHYGARGWVLHHNTDIWRGTAPINHANHGIWPTGGAWLCLHLWEHWRYSGDRGFLATRAYPVLKDAAQFFLDVLVEDPEHGWLISGPSNSPEHGGLVMGPTMDHQIIRGLFTWTSQAARELGVDAEFAAHLDATRARLAPNQIGRHGQLQEWLEDKDDPENRHRHVSHLWGAFPGEDITWNSPELMKAVKRSLEMRGDGGTGWSLGWKLALWARLLDGDHAHRILMNQLSLVEDSPDGGDSKGGGGTYPNLFDAHPPFQIDGNFAATAGICEMLLQSHVAANGGDVESHISDLKFEINLLPALPSAWPDGSITGVRARGGFELDIAWRNGALERVVVRSMLGRPAVLRNGDRVVSIDLPAGGVGEWSGTLKPANRDPRSTE